MFHIEDLKSLIEQGHELGCHTFRPLRFSGDSDATFEDSILENREALNRLFPFSEFRDIFLPDQSAPPAYEGKDC